MPVRKGLFSPFKDYLGQFSVKLSAQYLSSERDKKYRTPVREHSYIIHEDAISPIENSRVFDKKVAGHEMKTV